MNSHCPQCDAYMQDGLCPICGYIVPNYDADIICPTCGYDFPDGKLDTICPVCRYEFSDEETEKIKQVQERELHKDEKEFTNDITEFLTGIKGDVTNTGLVILSIAMPLIGFILFCLNLDKKPKSAKVYLCVSLLTVIIYMFIRLIKALITFLI